MVRHLESQTINLSQLFNQEFFFRIPEYQRPFSWDDDNLGDLVDDLIGAPRDADYFLGTLVLHDVGGGTYDVVDGQQRLTSLCILLACIRDALSLGGQSEIQMMLVQPDRPLAGIQARNRLAVKDAAAFNKIVCTPGGTTNTAGLDEKIGNGERKYRDAVSIFSKRLTTMTPEAVQDLAAFMLQHCVVIYLAAQSFDDAFRLFTVVNDRGKQLRKIDILKAENLAPTVIADEDIRTKYARKWEELEEKIGEDNFEDFFSSLRLIYVQEKPQGDLHVEFNKRVFGQPNRPSRGVNFVDALEKYVGLYDSLFVLRDYLDLTEDKTRFAALMTAMVDEFRASEWRACVLQYANHFGTKYLMRFLLDLEKVFVEQWVDGVRKDERYSVYTNLLKTIDAAKNPDEVLSQVVFDTKKISEACTRIDFYHAGFAKYMLIRAEISTSELNESRVFRAKSIEHVLPQNPAANSQWRRRFSQDDIAEVVHTAGNLVLLSKSKNSSAQNKDFEDKKATYLQPRVTDFPRSVQVLAVDAWTKAVIKRRTAEFAKIVLMDP